MKNVFFVTSAHECFNEKKNNSAVPCLKTTELLYSLLTSTAILRSRR